jgi:hypothetical protein
LFVRALELTTKSIGELGTERPNLVCARTQIKCGRDH